MVRAKHLIFNATSPHTLLSTYQMRELGVIVDDVSKRHLKDANTKGTHSISFPRQGHTISLTTKGALPTFPVTKPTLAEYINTPENDIVDISIENWSPQDHHEDLLKTTPGVEILSSVNHTSTMNASIMEPEAIINLISQFDDDNGNHSPTFFDCDEDEFFDASNEEEQVFYDSTDYKEESHDIAFRGDRGVQQNASTSSSTNISKNRIMMTATACMAMTSADASKCFMPKDMNEKLLDKDNLYYFDAEDLTKPPKPGRVLHLSIDYQTIGQGEKGRQSTCAYTSYNKVNALLSDLDYNLLVGKSETFNTLTCALTTVEKMQRIETLQPRLAWKPLEVIKRTLENTTQWGRVISQYPMKKHHVSRFPWDNRQRLREEVAMETIFMSKSGFCGSTCKQVYLGLMSRMLNVYPMPSKAQGYILKSYQDSMRYEGLPEGLHRDLAPA